MKLNILKLFLHNKRNRFINQNLDNNRKNYPVITKELINLKHNCKENESDFQ
jgi:hypothetical protein